MAINQAQKAVRIKRDIFTLCVGTPINSAVSFAAPVAKIQLPTCVLVNNKKATIPKIIHQIIDTGKSTPPICKLLLNMKVMISYPLAVSRPPS